MNNSSGSKMSKPFRFHVLLVLLIFLPAESYSQNTDIGLLRRINSPVDLRSDNFFRFVTNSAVYVSIITPVSMGSIGLIKDDRNLLRNSEVMAGASFVSFGITAALKYSVKRVRPFVTYPDINRKSSSRSPSFPSGHTSMAFATATSLSLAYPKWYVIAPSYGWAALVGYSRMHLGVHCPSDVLAGMVIGVGTSCLFYFVANNLK